LDKLEDFQKIQDRVPIAALNPINVKPMTEFKRG
jgi:biotin synthase-like enzyme